MEVLLVFVTLPRITTEETPGDEDALRFLEEALRTPLAPHAKLLAVTVPASSEAAEKFLRLVPREMGFLFRSVTCQIAGGGVVAKLTAVGENRFRELARQMAALWESLEQRSLPGATFAPIVFGGASFAPHVPPVAPWEEFTEDTFTMPRWGYRRQGERAYVTLTATREELERPDLVESLLSRTKHLLRDLEHEAATSLIQRTEIPSSSVHHMSNSDWRASIDRIKEAIASGAFEKIVAARRSVIHLDRPLDDTIFMARLFAAYPECNHFAVRRERSTFLGATPETLFRVDGRELTTHALAGTTRLKDPFADSTPEVMALSSSQKDLAEHGLVAKKIFDAIWPLAKKIRYSATPRTRQVRNLVHLETPISAELKANVNAADLLAALHPTPAVGGYPAREAADWIRRNEPMERGWYAGVVGWADAAGSAEFAVAIRCGVLAEDRAYIFAGAGVVGASDADAEYQETAAKMTPLLRALGVL
jgi:isochorismate synthase